MELGYKTWRKEWSKDGNLLVEDYPDGRRDLESAKFWTKRYGAPIAFPAQIICLPSCSTN